MNLNDPAAAKDALERALATDNPDTIAKAAMVHIWPLYSSHYVLLTEAVEQLPGAVVDRYPVLKIVHPMTAIVARAHQPYKPLVYADAARDLGPDEVAALVLGQMIAFRMSGDVAAAVIYARRLEERIAQMYAESRHRTDGPLWFLHLQVGSTYLAAGDSARALLQFATARQLGRLSIQEDAERFALARIALAHAVRGSLDEAQRALDELAGMPEPTAAHLRACTATEATAAALIAVERMDDDAEEALRDLEPYDSFELTWPFALLARARWFLAHQRPGDALEAVSLARDAHPSQQGSAASDILASISVQAFLALHDDHAARRTVDEFARVGELTELAAVAVDVREGRQDAAARTLRQFKTEELGPTARAKHLILSAWLQLTRTRGVDESLAIAIARLAATRSIRRLLAMTASQLIDAVRDALPADAVAKFDRSIAGLTFHELEPRPTLTPSELRLLRSLPMHATIAEIAAEFHVSPNTVKSQLKSLYRKLGCRTREAAIDMSARFAGNAEHDRVLSG